MRKKIIVYDYIHKLMIINLTHQQYDYLENTFFKEYTNSFENFLIGKNGNQLHLDEDALHSIRDWAGEKLMQVAFDHDYNFTPEGRQLADIIDLLYI